MKTGITFIILSTLVVRYDAHPQARGSIHGVVVNRVDKQPIAGANVLVQGTVLGTASDREGKFFLRSVPVGQYSLAISILGFQRKIIPGVEVRTEKTDTLAIDLEPTPLRAEPVVVTASKREQSLQEVPVSVSVLDGRELMYRNSVTLDEALRYVPGVNMTQGQINIRGSTGYSRGVGTRVLLLVDGLPLLSGDTGEIIWENLPVYQIDRVEVVKGAGSALYGSSALGGVINVLTKEVGDMPDTKVRMYGGLYETPKYPRWRWTDESRLFNGLYASHAERFGDLELFLGGSRTADEGFKRNDSWRRYNGSIRMGYDLSEFESLGLLFSFMDQRRGNFFYWKDLENALIPEDDQLNQQVHSSRWSLASSYKKYVSGRFFYTVKGSWFRTRWEDNIVSSLDSDGDRSVANFVNAELQTIYEASETHTLTTGVYAGFNTVSADTIFGNRSGYGVAVYAQDEIQLHPEVLFILGARYDAQTLKDAGTFGQFNPKAGLTYNPDPDATFRLSVGSGFRAPSVAEVFTTTEAGGLIILPNPGLRPERSWSFEIGGSRTIGENIFAQLALFQNEFWNLIEPTFSSDGGVRFQNVTRARTQGLEIGLQTNWFRRTLAIETSYTYVYPKDVTNQDLLKYRPRHILYASGRLTFDHVQFGLDYRYLSKVEKIDDEFVLLGIVTQGDHRVPISVADARLNLDWGFVDLPLASSFHVNNVFGYYYVELIGNIAPIRNYVVTLEARL